MTDPLADLYDARRREDMLGVSIEANRLVAAKPVLGARWAEVANLAYEMGDELTAYNAAVFLTDQTPADTQSWLWRASMLNALGRHEDALSILETQASKAPGDGAVQRRIGRTLLDLGRPSLAKLCFKRAIELNAMDALAWEGLAQSHVFASGDNELVALEQVRIQGAETMSDTDRGIISYSLSKAYVDVGEMNVAAMRVSEGASFYRQGAPFDIEQHEMAINALIQTYSRDFIESREDVGVLDGRPVLVMAMPCAGADWLTDVLAADPMTGALARSNSLLWLNSAPLGDQSWQDMQTALDSGWRSNLLGEVAKRYLKQADEAVGERRSRIIDPSTVAEMAAGGFGLSLPAAKMIHIVRDPCDLAWSVYKTRFRKARNWTYHPDDIARVISCHRRITDHWKDVFGDRIMTVSYEDIVRDPQQTARDAAAFIGGDQDGAAAEAWLRSDGLKSDPVGVHEEAGERFAPVQAALKRADLL